MPGYSPKLPMELDDEDGYALTKTTLEAVKQNLKMIILTSPGERCMYPDFGVGLRRFLFEQANFMTYDNIRTEISQQVSKWMPFVTIIEVAIAQPEDNTFISSGIPISIQIRYSVSGINASDILEISMSETT